jgi:LDH2 family malate/lactate/ureidoglycolate dehydrogenase
MSTIFIPVVQLRQFMSEAFRAVGVPPADADIIVDVLIRSDLRGIESHGIGRFKMYIDRIRSGILKPVTQFEIVRESPGMAVVDGHDGMGHVIAYRSMRLAMDKARQVGIAAVSVRNSSHFGIAGYYPLMAARENMAGMAFTNARPSISPTFGADPMFGTNPIAFAVPTDEGCPFCLDMATSIVQRGKIEVLERKQKPVPPGLAIDKQGENVLDATELLKLFDGKAASLLPLGGQGEALAGYKGYGLAMMVEILSSVFNGGPFGWALSGVDEEGRKTPHHLGHFFIAMDVSHFMEPDQFKKLAGDLVRSIRTSEKLPGEARIYTAGEKEWDWEQIVPEQGVPLNESLEKDMRQVKKDLNLGFELPF